MKLLDDHKILSIINRGKIVIDVELQLITFFIELFAREISGHVVAGHTTLLTLPVGHDEGAKWSCFKYRIFFIQ